MSVQYVILRAYRSEFNSLDVPESPAMTESYYTPEQLAQLKQRAGQLGPDAIRAAEQEWPQLIAKAQALMDAGAPPADPQVQAVARRWKELVDAFTGGDPGIAESLGNLWKEKGPEMAGKMNLPFDPKLFAFIAQAQKYL
jgi:MerR family transcriptional regulator, thiopeptide resistance regulator